MVRRSIFGLTCLLLAMASAQIAAPAMAQDIIPPKSYTTTPSGINLADGSFQYSVTDLDVGTMKLERFLRDGKSQTNDPMFGWNFDSNFDIWIAGYQSSSNVNLVVHIGNSASGTYQRYGTNQISPLNDDAGKGNLAWTGTQYIYTDNTGTIYTFSATIESSGMPFPSLSRKIERIDFPDGRRQYFSYSGSNLKLVEDTAGYAIGFDYVTGTNDVSAACAFVRAQTYVAFTTGNICTGATMKTSYTYSSTSLVTARDVLQKDTLYTNSGRLTCIKPPPGTTCSVSFPSTYKINEKPPGQPMTSLFGGKQTLADGAVWEIQGTNNDVEPPNVDNSPSTDKAIVVTVIDPDMKSTYAEFTKSSVRRIVDANQKTTEFKFVGAQINPLVDPPYNGSMLIEAKYPEGNTYLASYGGPLNSITQETLVDKSGNTANNLVKTYTYGTGTCPGTGTYQNCTKPTRITDPKGYWTDYTYASHGGVLTEMQPAPSSGLARPVKITTWVQKTPYVKNSSGVLQAATLPGTSTPVLIWVKNTETWCETATGANPSPTCSGTSQQQLTTYEYGAANTGRELLVKGVAVSSAGTTLRTCYQFDTWHRQMSERKPNGVGASSCP